MGGSKTVIQQPTQIDPSESMGEYLFGTGFKDFEGITDPRLQQRIIEAEAQFRPQYTALELAEQEAALFGREGQSGLLELQRRAGEEAIDFEEAAKRRETALLGELGADVTQALRAADPRAARLADLQAQQAETLYREAEGQLSPERAREAEQAARMAGVARGRVGDAGTLAQELLGREASRAQLRAEARQAGQLGFGQARQIGGDPTAFLFGRPTQQTQMGSQLYGQAFGLAAQQQGPQLFDPNVGVNLALQQRSQDMALQGAQAQAAASRSAGRSSMLGSIIGGALMGGF